jgi:hypothetical protein
MVPQEHVQCVTSDLLVEAILDQEFLDVLLLHTTEPPVQFILEQERCEFLGDLRLWLSLKVERLSFFVGRVH